MARIAIGGFSHETNTSAPSKARYEDFITPGGWPGLTRGEAPFDAVAGINLSIAGFVEGARAAGHQLVLLLWCNATPAAHVERDAYERICGMLLEDLARAAPIDAIYLDLHGAMVAKHLEDGEGELLRRVRQLVGDRTPVVVSLDLTPTSRNRWCSTPPRSSLAAPIPMSIWPTPAWRRRAMSVACSPRDVRRPRRCASSRS